MANPESFKNREEYLSYQREYRKKDYIKVHTRKLVFIMKRNGTIIYKPCEVCGKIKTEAHHDNYNLPYAIRFLCKKHHGEFHSKHKYDENTLSYIPY